MAESNFTVTNIAGAVTAGALLTGNTKVAQIAGGVATAGRLISSVASALRGEAFNKIAPDSTVATWAGTQTDWRVRLDVPLTNQAFFDALCSADSVISPLFGSNFSMIFPFTPQVNITHSANYNSLDVVHSNYPFLSYQNSKIDQITITGDFYCESSVDAAYWMAVVHFLRTLTKMNFGDQSNDAGQPPPVAKLNGYGDFVFNNVPVVVKSFSVDMPKDVDYVRAKPGSAPKQDETAGVTKIGYAPSKSVISVSLMPIYSRTQQRQFNLSSFVKGDYVLGSAADGNNAGFI